MQRLTMAVLVAGSIGLGASAAQSATIVENFDYGDTSGNLSIPEPGRGTGTGGWGGGWFGDGSPDYVADRNLAYTASGYSNAGNGGGVAAQGGGDAGSIASRLFESPITSGTVWISALAEISSNSGDALLWLRNDPHGPNANAVSIRGSVNTAGTGPVAYLRYGGNTNTQTTETYALDTAHLLLAKVDVNYDGTSDRIQFWVNPNLTGGEAGLGAPLLMGEGADMMAAVAGVRVSFGNIGSALDAIRISNDADGFTQVTAVPEPASLAALGLAAGALLVRRRR